MFIISNDISEILVGLCHQDADKKVVILCNQCEELVRFNDFKSTYPEQCSKWMILNPDIDDGSRIRGLRPSILAVCKPTKIDQELLRVVYTGFSVVM